MKIDTLHTNLASLSAFLVSVMAINFKVLHTCRGRVAMVTIFVEMFSLFCITVYVYPLFGKHIYLCKRAKLCQNPMSS